MGALLAALLLAFPVAACARVPSCERTQLRLISRARAVRLGRQAWKRALAGRGLETGTARADRVERVGRRLAATGCAVHAWRFDLVRDDATADAYVLPGGTVALTTGLLAIVPGDDALAGILAHEMGHDLAHHGLERLSHAVLCGGAPLLLEGDLSDASPAARARVMEALGLGGPGGAGHPYVRLQEYEADGLGLRLMVRAGYNPHAAVRLWERLATRAPTLVATHPDAASRAARLARLVPKVLSEERPTAAEAPAAAPR
jgi:predicted Zn-dependent protease